MARFFVYPYGPSEGARDLAAGLGAVVSRREHPGDAIVINWGAGDCPYPNALNKDNRVVLNKQRFFERLEGMSLTPRFCTVRGRVERGELGFPVFCRSRVEGRDGEGITIADDANQVVDARLYVEAINKQSEYRIHVGRLPSGEHVIIGMMQKFRRRDAPGDNRIWTGEETKLVWTVGGRQVENIAPREVIDATIGAFIRFPELTFAAFDVVWDGQRAFVLEANSAPMMTPKTVEKYVHFFNAYAAQLERETVPVEQSITTPLDPEHSSVDALLERWRSELTTLIADMTAPSPVCEATEEQCRAVMQQFYEGDITLRQLVEGYLRG